MKILPALVLVLALLTPLTGVAQEIGVAGDPTFTLDPLTEDNDRNLALYTNASILPESDIKGEDSDVRVTRFGLGGHYSIFSFDYGYSAFDWGSGVDLGTGQIRAPFNALHDVSLQARVLQGTFNERWHYWLNAEASSAFEETFPGALGAGFNGELAYDFWDGWMIGGLVRLTALNALNSDLFADAELGFAIHVSQHQVRTLLTSLGIIDPKETTKDKYTLRFAYSGQEKTYRLSSKSELATNGYVGIRRSKVGAYLDLFVNDSFTLSLGPEYHFGRSYTVYNSSGTRVSEKELDSTVGGYIGLSWTY